MKGKYSASTPDGSMLYHLTCYRNFTDITKIERAKKIAENELLDCSAVSTSKDGDCDSLRDADNEKTLSNVLAKCCLICKQSGPIYVTDTVCIRI